MLRRRQNAPANFWIINETRGWSYITRGNSRSVVVGRTKETETKIYAWGYIVWLFIGRETVWHGTDSVGATSAARCLVLHNLPPGFFCLTSTMLSYIHMLDAYEDSKTCLCQQQQRSRNKAKHAFSPVMSWVVPQGKPKQHTSWGEAYPVQTATRKNNIHK
jgi:hypothetical protein